MTSHPNTPGAPPVRTGLVMTVLGSCFLLVMMDNTILNVALETIQRDLDATTSQLQWAVDSYILVYAALMFSAGVLADRVGRRRTLVAGLVVFAVASLGAALSASPEALIGWRGLMGVGASVVPPTTLAIIKDSLPTEKHAGAMGLWAGIGGLSVAFGPILGGALLEVAPWGSIFLINLPVALSCIVLALFVVPESTGSRAGRLDLPGVALAMASIASLVYGVIRAGEGGEWLSPGALGPIVAGVVLASLLVVVERRTPDPALDVSLFVNRAFSAGTLAVSSAFLALTGGTFALVFYVQLVRGHSPLELGVILLPVAVGSVATAVGSRAVVDRLGYRMTVATGLALLIASLGALLVINAVTPLAILEVALFVAGLGMGLTMGSTTSLVMSAVPAAKAGVGSAVTNTVRQVGAALGVAIVGSVMTTHYRHFATPRLSALPDDVGELAAGSLSATMQVLARLRPQLGDSAYTDAVAQARAGYVDAMHAGLWPALAVLVAGLVATLVWAPGQADNNEPMSGADTPGAASNPPRAASEHAAATASVRVENDAQGEAEGSR